MQTDGRIDFTQLSLAHPNVHVFMPRGHTVYQKRKGERDGSVCENKKEGDGQRTLTVYL